MICIARTLGAPESVPAGRVHRANARAQPPRNGADDVHHVAVALDLLQCVDADAAVLADASKIVAAEIDEHHVLSHLLGVAEQLDLERRVLLRARTARAGSGDRSRNYLPTGHRDQWLGARARELEVAEVEEVHVRTRVDDAQSAVDRESIHRDRRRPAL
jgi:hypothetical protein